MGPEHARQYADKLIDELSDLDKSMAQHTIALYGIMAKADPETVVYVEKRYRELILERTERMRDVMASQAAKDVSNRKARENHPMILKITPLPERQSLLAPREVVCDCSHPENRHGILGGSCDRDGCDCREFRPNHMGP